MEPKTKNRPPATLDGANPEDIPRLYALHQFIEDPGDLSYEEDNPPLILPEAGFRLELGGSSDANGYPLGLENQDFHFPYYKTHFYGKTHYNFVAGTASNPMVISLVQEGKKVKKQTNWKAIVREKKENHHFSVSSSKKQNAIKKLKMAAPELLGQLNLIEVKDTTLCDELVNMEDRMFIKAYKFGFVYCDKDQTNELDMFSNTSVSKSCEKFLNLIGKEVSLKGHTGYRGGLDIQSDTTGTHSFINHFKGFDIMYHVSHYLPHSPENPQQLHRKRHIGNDVVVIVYTENPHGFLPSTITSKFNHVYVVIHPLPKAKGETRKYHMGLACKSGTRVSGPPLPSVPVFEHGDEFVNFLLTKIINAERAAYFAPGFAQTRTRRLWLKEIVEKHETK